MRVAMPPPPTEGARGRNICQDACVYVSKSKPSGTFNKSVQERTSENSGAPERINEKGRACEDSEGAGADRRRFMSKNNSRGNKHKKSKKKKQSRWRRFDGESARQYEERMEVDMIRDLEEAYEGTFLGKHDSGRLDKGKRRSKRLAKRQQRMRRH